MAHVMQVLKCTDAGGLVSFVQEWSSLLLNSVQWDLPVWANICRRCLVVCTNFVRLYAFNRWATMIDQRRSIATNLVSCPFEPVLFSLDELNITLFVVECTLMSAGILFGPFHCALLQFACKWLAQKSPLLVGSIVACYNHGTAAILQRVHLVLTWACKHYCLPRRQRLF